MSAGKAFLILHGKQALNEEVRAAVEQQREAGWELAVRLTWGPEMRSVWCRRRWTLVTPT